MPSVHDDFVVTTNGCEDDRCGPDVIASTAIALLSLKASTHATACLFTRGRGHRQSRMMLLGGGVRERLRCLLTGRVADRTSVVQMNGEEIFYAWWSLGTRWSMRISLPDGNAVQTRTRSWPIAEAFVDLAIEAMRRLGDDVERDRGRAVSEAIAQAAQSAACQLPAGTVLACPGPRGPLGPELGERGKSWEEHTHGAAETLRDRLEADHPPCFRAWFSHSGRLAGRPDDPSESRHLGLHGDYAIAISPGDPMERIRGLARIPDGERWFR